MSAIVNLQDGARTVVLFLSGLCEDGTGETLVAKTAVNEMNPSGKRLRIKKIEYNVSGGIVSLYRDTTDPVKIVDLAGDGSLDFSSSGGMPEAEVDGSDADSGNILLSTMGFDIGSSYAIRLELIKKPLG